MSNLGPIGDPPKNIYTAKFGNWNEQYTQVIPISTMPAHTHSMDTSSMKSQYQMIEYLQQRLDDLQRDYEEVVDDLEDATQIIKAVRRASGAKDGESLLEVVKAKCASHNAYDPAHVNRMSEFARSIVEVQPLTAPTGLIFTLRATYSSGYQAYDRAMKVIE